MYMNWKDKKKKIIISGTAPLLTVTSRINVNKFTPQQCHQKMNILNFVKGKIYDKALVLGFSNLFL